MPTSYANVGINVHLSRVGLDNIYVYTTENHDLNSYQ